MSLHFSKENRVVWRPAVQGIGRLLIAHTILQRAAHQNSLRSRPISFRESLPWMDENMKNDKTC